MTVPKIVMNEKPDPPYTVEVYKPNENTPYITFHENPWLAILYAFNMALSEGVWYTRVIETHSRATIVNYYLKYITNDGLVVIK